MERRTYGGSTRLYSQIKVGPNHIIYVLPVFMNKNYKNKPVVCTSLN